MTTRETDQVEAAQEKWKEDAARIGASPLPTPTLFASSSQQCFSLTSNQHQSSATNQPVVFFSHNKSAPITNHNQPNRVVIVASASGMATQRKTNKTGRRETETL